MKDKPNIEPLSGPPTEAQVANVLSMLRCYSEDFAEAHGNRNLYNWAKASVSAMDDAFCLINRMVVASHELREENKKLSSSLFEVVTKEKP